MANKTYANLSVTTSIGSSDLLAVYPTGGPLTAIAWSNVVAQAATDLTPTFLKVSNNLSDLNSAGVARSNLGLGSVATLNTGTTSGTVAVLGANGKTPISTLPGGYLAKSGNYTVTAADCGKLIDCTNSITITLPAASTVGETFFVDIRNSGSGTVTVSPASGTVDGAASRTQTPGEVRQYVNNATNYFSFVQYQVWTLIETKTTTSGTSVVIGPLPRAYSDIKLVFEGVACSGTSRGMNMSVSADGSSYSGTYTPTGNSDNTFWGAITFENYNDDVSAVDFTIATNTSVGTSPALNTNNDAQVGSAVAHVTGGIQYIKFVPITALQTFNAGEIRVYGR